MTKTKITKKEFFDHLDSLTTKELKSYRKEINQKDADRWFQEREKKAEKEMGSYVFREYMYAYDEDCVFPLAGEFKLTDEVAIVANNVFDAFNIFKVGKSNSVARGVDKIVITKIRNVKSKVKK